MFELLKTLCEIPGAVGNEHTVQEYLYSRWAPRSQKVHRDGVGNLIAHVGGQGRRLLITAHADETSFLIKSISDEGFLFVSSNFPTLRPPSYLHFLGHPALAVGLDGQRIEGIFATASGHATTATQRESKQLEWNDIFVDIGAHDAQSVIGQGLEVGCPIVWNSQTRRVGEHVCGKAMDDRMGLAIMDRLLMTLNPERLKYDLYLVSTVQEELGMVGVSALQRHEQFDLAICLDIGLAGDIPTLDMRDIPVKLGRGPVLVIKDSRVHYDRSLTLSLRRLAEDKSIPIQLAVFHSYASDGLRLVQAGIETALIAPPCRYTHSPYEMIHEADLTRTVDLLKEFLVTWDNVD